MLAVILVVAILATGGFIAIQRIRGGAQSSVAKTNLSTAVTALVTAHGIEQDGKFDAATAADLAIHLSGFVEDLTVVAMPVTTPTTKGWEWTLADNAVAVTSNLGDDISATAWKVSANDAVWLVTRAEDGDTYCAMVVLEIAGDTSYAGTRYDAAKSDSNIATCGAVGAATGAMNTAAAAEADELIEAKWGSQPSAYGTTAPHVGIEASTYTGGFSHDIPDAD